MTDEPDQGAADAVSSQLKWDRANPVAKWAHRALASAIRAGIVKRGPCEVCGAVHGIDGAVIHGHHDNYERPKDVRWLCRLHHRQHHARERAQGQTIERDDSQAALPIHQQSDTSNECKRESGAQ